ncbi:hypothetical protein EJ04DRAFT_432509 [Polyplosphaeria fusca]|uniref:RBR-type E3 ubiquitin transferase n=1 Tax=Polyplosphaeria fusca TaxID=682080 RepID=A0A9P4V3E6_9PLEO|nr:hypothetical protein EJ04DRAFT_432509 [Polyplosphaeria fusca]
MRRAPPPPVKASIVPAEKPLPKPPVLSRTRSIEFKTSNRICEVCKDAKQLSKFPSRATTSSCAHGRNTCTECIQRWIETCMDSKGWDHCVCPECVESLEYDDVKALATNEVFAKYDSLSTRAALSTIPNFRWCQSPICPSGQIHDGTPMTNPVFTCMTCGHTYCLRHPTSAFHFGESCEQYDARLAGTPTAAQKVLKEKEGEMYVRAIGKRCPNAMCGWWIIKTEGCDHMTCWKCRFEFCWECSSNFGVIRKKGTKYHRINCRYYA